MNILEQNTEFVLVNKPAQLSVHNAANGESDLIQDLEKKMNTKVYPVHRLDKETSGLMLLALNSNAAKTLSALFSDHNIIKKYQALVKNKSLQPDSSASWNFQLTDKAEGRKNPQGIVSQRKNCLTHYKVLKTNQYFALLECEIKTGRQHQIRKHAALAQCPVVGDNRYGSATYNEKIASIYGTSRMFLNAFYLEFDWNGKHWKYSIDLPADFNTLLS